MYWIKVRSMKSSGRFTYFINVASYKTWLKYGPLYFLVTQLLPDSFILDQYWVFSAKEISKFCKYCVAAV